MKPTRTFSVRDRWALCCMAVPVITLIIAMPVSGGHRADAASTDERELRILPAGSGGKQLRSRAAEESGRPPQAAEDSEAEQRPHTREPVTPAASARWRIATADVPQGITGTNVAIDSEALRLHSDGATKRIALRAVVSVAPDPPRAGDRPETCVLLAGGERIAGVPERVADELLVIRHAAAHGGRWRIPLQHVRAVLVQRPPGQRSADELLARLEELRTRDDQAWLLSGLPVRGELTDWRDAVLTFATELGEVRVKQSATRAVLLAADLSVPVSVPRGAHWLMLLQDGSTLRLVGLKADGRIWTGTTSWGEPFSIAGEAILRVRFFGGQAEYLTAARCRRVERKGYWPPLLHDELPLKLAADAERAWLRAGAAPETALEGWPMQTARDGRAAVPVWPVWQNRNALGWPLRSQETVYAIGWGVLGAAELEFEIPAGPRRFVARCGPDLVSAGSGTVQFFVESPDGKVLWRSDVLREAKGGQFVAVELPAATRRLVLRTDYAERGDIRDFANWFAPYVLLPNGPP